MNETKKEIERDISEVVDKEEPVALSTEDIEREFRREELESNKQDRT
jgi:hypothetical protein